MLWLFIRNTFRYLKYKVAHIFKNPKFTLLYAFAPFHLDILKQLNFIALLVPSSGFLADPFVIEKNGKQFIFFEEYENKKGKAHISVITIDEAHKVSKPEKVLEKEYHLSYPFVFEWERSFYMIPETAANKTVELYQCTSFPNQWKILS